MKKLKKEGFTLIEVMVAMVVLAIGLLGMAAMTILVMRGNKSADQLTIATSLATQKMEVLKDTGFNDLGTAASAADSNYYDYGVTSSHFTGPEGPFNALGETSSVTDASYIYYRSFSVCWDADTFCGSDTSSGLCTDSLCDLLGTATDGLGTMVSTATTGTPKELACYGDSANASEKRLRVVTYWKDRFGKCHRVAMETIVVDLE